MGVRGFWLGRRSRLHLVYVADLVFVPVKAASAPVLHVRGAAVFGGRGPCGFPISDSEVAAHAPAQDGYGADCQYKHLVHLLPSLICRSLCGNGIVMPSLLNRFFNALMNSWVTRYLSAYSLPLIMTLKSMLLSPNFV